MVKKMMMQDDDEGEQEVVDANKDGVNVSDGKGHDPLVPRIGKYPTKSLAISGRGSKGEM